MRVRMSSFPTQLGVVAVVAGAIRAFYIFVITPSQQGYGDWIFYHSVANALADGTFFIDPFAAGDGREIATASHPPLYPVVLSGVSLLGGTGHLSHRALGILLGAAGVVLIGLLGRRVGGDRVGIVAAGLATIYPIFIAADGALLSEVLYTPVLALTLLWAFRVHDGGGPVTAAGLGALIGLCALTRSEAMLLVPLLGIPVAWGLRDRRVLRVGAVAVAFALVMAPWTIRNLDAFEALVPVSTQDGSLIGGANCPETYFGPELGGWSLACLSPRSTENEADQSKIWRQDGVDYASDNAGRIPLVVLVRLLKLNDFYEPRRQLMFAEGRNQDVQGAGVGMYWLLVPLAVFGAVLLRRRRDGLWILLAPVVMVVVSAVIGYGITRLRHGADVATLVMAAVALVELARRLATRRERARGRPAAVR